MGLQGYVLFVARALKTGRLTASLDTGPMETASILWYQPTSSSPGKVSGQGYNRNMCH